MKVLFTGGGTAGHVTPNVALIEHFRKLDMDVVYVGSVTGIERNIIANIGIRYLSISSGKFRRYFDWQNFIDPFRIIWGLLQSLVICLREHPQVVFSKGGFVAVPVVVAAWLLRIPVICHESDVTPGLSTRLCSPLVQTICVNFPQTTQYLKSAKTLVTGTPIREALFKGDDRSGRDALSFTKDKPIVMVFGGSLGAARINAAVRGALDELLSRYQVVHVVGAGNLDNRFASPGYVQREYLYEEFGDVLAAAEVVVARAGANSIYELLVIRKPHILIPLSLVASRGDQLDNARTFSSAGYSRMLDESLLDGESLVSLIDSVYRDRESIVKKIEKFEVIDSVTIIAELIQATGKGSS